MRDDSIQIARRFFAEELRHTARVQSPTVVEAFAGVPREHFAGPGPWRLLSPIRMSDYWTTEDDDPAHLYHDVLVAIDETRRLNSGQPSLWACLYDQLGLVRGAHVVHIGIGTGYYTTVLAEIVGATGRVTAVEVDPDLAARQVGPPAFTTIASLLSSFRDASRYYLLCWRPRSRSRGEIESRVAVRTLCRHSLSAARARGASWHLLVGGSRPLRCSPTMRKSPPHEPHRHQVSLQAIALARSAATPLAIRPTLTAYSTASCTMPIASI